MGCGRAQNIQINPHDAYWEVEETLCFDFTGQTPSGIEEKYISVYNPTGTHYAFWFNVDSGSTAPTVSGATLVEVAITSSNTAAQITAAFEAELEATISGFSGTSSGTNYVAKYSDFSEFSDDANAGDSTVEVAVVSKGGQVYLGLLDGDVSITPEQTFLDVTAHQTGQTILSKITQNLGATVELTCKEFTKAIYKGLISAAGGSFTPGSGTEVYGWGTAKLSVNIFKYAKRLRLTPVGAADESNDWTFWKTFPEIGGITLSGENPQTLPVTFSAFPDDNKPTAVNIFAIGDGTQTGL